MIAILKPNVPQEQIDNLIRWLKSQGLQIHISHGEYQTVLGLVGNTSAEADCSLRAEHCTYTGAFRALGNDDLPDLM